MNRIILRNTVIGSLLILISLWNCSVDVQAQDIYRPLRERMVAEQIEARGISDEKVLSAMRKVERHRFVPEKYRGEAYGDHPLPIGEGQTISQPYVVALMTEVVKPQPDIKVLEIGTGSGYQAAVLAELCKSVYTIEIVEKLGRQAQIILAGLYKNVQVKIGDGYQGWPEQAPFDAILVTCSPTHVPQPLADQLREGGKMVIPVGKERNQNLVVLTKTAGKLHQETIIPVRFVKMVDSQGKTY